jgi:hypothetical protein
VLLSASFAPAIGVSAQGTVSADAAAPVFTQSVPNGRAPDGVDERSRRHHELLRASGAPGAGARFDDALTTQP